MKRRLLQQDTEVMRGKARKKVIDITRELLAKSSSARHKSDRVKRMFAKFGAYITNDGFALCLNIGEHRSSLLHAAVYGEDISTVEYLCAEKFPLEVRDAYGQTPLILAAAQGAKTIIDILAQNRTKFDAKNHKGVSPLLAAATKNHPLTVAKILQFVVPGNKQRILNYDRDNDGNNALMLAVINKCEKTIRYLFDVYKVDINVRNRRNECAVMLAVSAENKDVIRLFLKYLQENPEIKLALTDEKAKILHDYVTKKINKKAAVFISTKILPLEHVVLCDPELPEELLQAPAAVAGPPVEDPDVAEPPVPPAPPELPPRDPSPEIRPAPPPLPPRPEPTSEIGKYAAKLPAEVAVAPDVPARVDGQNPTAFLAAIRGFDKSALAQRAEGRQVEAGIEHSTRQMDSYVDGMQAALFGAMDARRARFAPPDDSTEDSEDAFSDGEKTRP
ncbi:MAG: ankyrin repeat domain-containing protein [Gammaproteobacteria bacterium]|nr:ankyrin repeat domain-containing protein [Gammaproteobacteria bacterium]